ncbi:hypothetical protein ACR6C2_24370 [Streptomyces sp. INA 01156]
MARPTGLQNSELCSPSLALNDSHTSWNAPTPVSAAVRTAVVRSSQLRGSSCSKLLRMSVRSPFRRNVSWAISPRERSSRCTSRPP